MSDAASVSTVSYTDPALVTNVISPGRPPNYRDPARGYGGKIPTRHMVRYLGRWRRVYVMQYGNAGSAYIVVNNRDLFLDIDTEYRLEGQAS